MGKLFKLKRFWFVLACIPAAALTGFAAENHAAVEVMYSSGIYRALSGIFGRITGFLPFSLAQWVLLAAVIFFVTYPVVMLRKIAVFPSARGDNAARLVGTLLCAAGIIWLGFVCLCGLNYHRMTFSEIYGLDVRPSPSSELAELCAELTEYVNTLSDALPRGETGATISIYSSPYETAKHAAAAYAPVGEKYPALAGFTPRAKPVTGSRLMSMADLVGVYFPFTFEANVNIDVPDYIIPSSMLHELAHFKGFMREDEANFISYLACVTSGDAYFAYSGAMLALVHSLNALYSADRDAYWHVYDMLGERPRADFRADSEYWKQFEGPVATVSEKVNDVYLKTNRQPSGVKSYGEMVDLLLAYRRASGGLTI